jgi:hypothetical protein
MEQNNPDSTGLVIDFTHMVGAYWGHSDAQSLGGKDEEWWEPLK